MRKWFNYLSFVLVVISTTVGYGQELPERLQKKYKKEAGNAAKAAWMDQHLLVMDNEELLKEATALRAYFQKHGDPVSDDYVQLIVANVLAQQGDYAFAVGQTLELLARFEQRKDTIGITKSVFALSVAYAYAKDVERTIHWDRKAIELAFALRDTVRIAHAYNNISSDFTQFGMQDSAMGYAKEALRFAELSKKPPMIAMTMSTLGEVYIAKKEYDTALPYIRSALRDPDVGGTFVAWAYNDYAEVMLGLQNPDSAIFYGRHALRLGKRDDFTDQVLRSYQLLSKSFEQKMQADSALFYFKAAAVMRDSVFTSEKMKQLQAIQYEDQLKQKELEKEQGRWKSRLKIYGLLLGMIVFSIIIIILHRNNRQKQKANKMLAKTLDNLKSTQTQLIHAEKMASLGELTAGIAHEIQNPLNFVNNFSELNTELIDELKTELESGNIPSAKEIAGNIRDNSEKINHHGKRADSIVKGMLQHSRNSSGQKEWTDINQLAEECMRLSYHGMRAKDKSFNVTMETHLDKELPKVQVVPQEIGRVLLNIFTNAFYSVMQKKKMTGADYTPAISLHTTHTTDSIAIIIRDNGTGIPQQVIDKIFQPFFTTKPTGQGTGLGLSMSYEIITKTHGGELEVETKEGEYALFTISLPVKS